MEIFTVVFIIRGETCISGCIAFFIAFIVVAARLFPSLLLLVLHTLCAASDLVEYFECENELILLIFGSAIALRGSAFLARNRSARSRCCTPCAYAPFFFWRRCHFSQLLELCI